MATTGHETEIIDVLGLLAALLQYKTNVSDAKADKDSDAVLGNVAMFDSSGNPVDGGTALSTIVSGAAAGATAILSTDLATVATTGSYNDLSNKPTIPPSMVILKYGSSTWNDFITAYSSNAIVYCRASSNSNPATGSQTRMAFMAYINNETTPTEVEFQYYRSVTTHSDSQLGDLVYIYKLKSTNGGTWENSVRSAFTKVAAGTNMTSSYSNGTITLNNPTTVSTFTNDAGYLVSNDIIDKAEKSEMSVVAGTGANADKTTITLKTGTSATVLTAHQDISGKQNTLVSGTNIKTINNESLLGSGNISVAAELPSNVTYFSSDSGGGVIPADGIRAETVAAGAAISVNPDVVTVVSGNVGTATITLQVPNDGLAHVWDILMTTGSSVNVTFATSTSATIKEPSGFEVGASKSCEVSVIGVGSTFYLRYGEFEDGFHGGGSND